MNINPLAKTTIIHGYDLEMERRNKQHYEQWRIKWIEHKRDTAKWTIWKGGDIYDKPEFLRARGAL